MKVTAVETIQLREFSFSNVLWIRLHTDQGLIGLGETFFGADAALCFRRKDLDSGLSYCPASSVDPMRLCGPRGAEQVRYHGWPR